ncbi:GGDEF domain-containing protein [Acinetobacter soli]|nr:GGDEF domain-containing protein [Acinetobacter soli]WEI09544.1 GGDEF domain-containing protein [Acinetobacter soli]
MLDVDHFKHINDQYGHHTGDQVLIAIAECLRQHSRQQDKIGRFGGEEFIVLLPQTSLRAARQVAERYRLALETLIISPSKHLHIQVSASFGVASCNEAEDSSQILTQADQALYLAKACGRNQVKSYTGDIQQFAHH